MTARRLKLGTLLLRQTRHGDLLAALWRDVAIGLLAARHRAPLLLPDSGNPLRALPARELGEELLPPSTEQPLDEIAEILASSPPARDTPKAGGRHSKGWAGPSRERVSSAGP